MKKTFKYLVPSLVWIAVITLLNLFFADNILNSDMSAEMVLAKYMSTDNKLVYMDWFYSTEIRLIYTQLISMFLFKFISSWAVVRALTMFICLMLLLIAYLYCMKPLELDEKAVYLSSMGLFLPCSMEYMDIVFVANSYIIHFILMFIVIGLGLRIFKKVTAKNAVLFILLNFLCGLCGVRYVIILIAPFFIAMLCEYAIALDEEGKKIFSFWYFKNLKLLTGFVACVAGVGGYLVNSQVLSKVFVYKTFEELYFTSLSSGTVYSNFSFRLSILFSDLFALFGYVPDAPAKSIWGVLDVSAILVVVFLILFIRKVFVKFKEYSRGVQLMSLIFAASFVLNIFVFVFIVGMYTIRYLMPVVVLIVPLAAIYLSHYDMSKNSNKFIIVILCLTLNFNSLISTVAVIVQDKNVGIKKACEFLESSDYSFGIASFWNAQVTTELTNGKVEMVGFDKDITVMHHWLMHKKYAKEEAWKALETDKIFYLLTWDEYQVFSGYPLVQAGEIVYADEYVILSYDKNELLKEFGDIYY